jgi:hypothetical protein
MATSLLRKHPPAGRCHVVLTGHGIYHDSDSTDGWHRDQSVHADVSELEIGAMPPRHVKGFRGSKPLNGKKKDRIKVIKMNDVEVRAATILAKKAGKSFSAYVRALLEREWDAFKQERAAAKDQQG